MAAADVILITPKEFLHSPVFKQKAAAGGYGMFFTHGSFLSLPGFMVQHKNL
jgi:hypothetical protein